MYSGFTKGSGDVVGTVIGVTGELMDLSETSSTSNAHESLMCIKREGDESAGIIPYVASLRPSNGEICWHAAEDESAVYLRTMSMGQMTSMLHDEDRNAVYEEAIKRCLAFCATKLGRAPTVLDVGTGTGLLAMMAARHGAPVVVACEMWGPMAQVAELVIRDNGLDDKITVMACKSTEMELGGRAEVLVSELLDSSLLGEACLLSHGDAMRRLVATHDHDGQTPGLGSIPVEQRVVPNRASVYATLVDGAGVRDYGRVHHGWLGHAPNDAGGYGATARVHRRPEDSACEAHAQGGLPVHFETLRAQMGAKELSAATPLFDVSLCGAHGETDEGFRRTVTIDIEASAEGEVSSLLLWWKVFLLDEALDPEEELMYSTEPGAQAWQDHWVQMIYPLPQSVVCRKGECVSITLSHDAMKIWINDAVNKDQNRNQTSGKRSREEREDEEGQRATHDPPRTCSCGWHLLYNTERMLQLNDSRRADTLRLAMDAVVTHMKNVDTAPATAMTGVTRCVVDVSDGSLLTLMLGAALADQKLTSQVKLVSLESKPLSRMLHGQLIRANGWEGHSMVWEGTDFSDIDTYFAAEGEEEGDEGDKGEKEAHTEADSVRIAALVSEAFFYQLPTLPIWAAHKLQLMVASDALQARLEEGAMVVPCRARLMAAAVHLTDLCRSHGACGRVSGFEHRVLDAHQADWHTHSFPYSLGEYDHTLLSEPKEVGAFTYGKNCTGFATSADSSISITVSGRCDAVAIWVDYDLTPAIHLKMCRPEGTGRQRFPLHCRTMIQFYKEPIEVEAGVSQVTCEVETSTSHHPQYLFKI